MSTNQIHAPSFFVLFFVFWLKLFVLISWFLYCFSLQVCLSMCDLLVDTRRTRINIISFFHLQWNLFFPISCLFRVYYGRLLRGAIAPNLVPRVLKSIFSSEMVKNDICLGKSSKQNVLFSKIVPLKNTPMSRVSGMGLAVSIHVMIDVNLWIILIQK